MATEKSNDLTKVTPLIRADAGISFCAVDSRGHTPKKTSPQESFLSAYSEAGRNSFRKPPSDS